MKPPVGKNYKTFVIRIINNPTKIIFWLKNKIRFYKKQFINQNKKYFFDIIIRGGALAVYKNHFKTDESTIYLETHAFDYDKFLEQEENIQSEFDNECKYSVFLDEDVCNHPDYTIFNEKPDCKPENYYPDLNQFFDYYEKETNHKIIIAKHPKNFNTENPFNDRKVISGKTIELVKYCKDVFMHTSTAINYAVLYKKPVYLIDSKKYSNKFRDEIKSTTFELNIPIYDISATTPFKFDYKLKLNEYRNFSTNYIKKKGTINKKIHGRYFLNF